MSLFRIYVGGEHLEDVFADPHWPMWYLSALFFWRLADPRVHVPLWGGLVVAVAVSLVAGLWAGDTLDLARVLGLLPFFVHGPEGDPRAARAAAPQAGPGRGRRRPRRHLRADHLDGPAGRHRVAVLPQHATSELGASDTRSMLTRAAVLAVGTLGALGVPRARAPR